MNRNIIEEIIKVEITYYFRMRREDFLLIKVEITYYYLLFSNEKGNLSFCNKYLILLILIKLTLLI